MSYYSSFPKYVSVAEKRAKAQKKLKQYRKKNPDIKPVIVQGNKLVKTWWGQAWNKNLEKYADYESRIGRGRSYIRNGFVIDLQINNGKVTSLVMGTSTEPYRIEIKIKPLVKVVWNHIKKECAEEIESLQELIEGKFPKALMEIFTAKGKGLFPSPSEISFNCSCPDWAEMCKHVAAALYGIGTRLDENPKLFFTLRNIEMDDLIHKAVKDKSKSMLKKARNKTSRVIDDNDVVQIFGPTAVDEIDFNSNKNIFRSKGKKLSKSGEKKNVKHDLI